MFEFKSKKSEATRLEVGRTSTREAAVKFAEDLVRAIEVFNVVNEAEFNCEKIQKNKDTDTILKTPPYSLCGYEYEFELLFTEGDDKPVKVIIKKELIK